ncbi:MAG TPA: BolA family transcriptional regulator [Candidatus Polarisedimenticolia bacterium]|nr:BolA family transcriptional regulator [Candidatus Polarisedimenticolia bacterium]
MDPGEIRRRVEAALPAAVIELRDTVGDADHYEMVVVSAAFEGKSTLERHRMVYAPLKDLLGGALHALALRTLAPGEPGAGG